MRWLLLLFVFTSAEAQITEVAKARTLRSGTSVTVTGRVTAGKEFGDLGFIQDGTGGIAIYDAVLTRGDSVVVMGKVVRFNAMVEIIADSIRKSGQPREVQARKIDARYVSEHEGELVAIANARTGASSPFFYPQRGGVLTSPSDTLTYWIDGDSNIPGYTIPTKPISIVGIVGRFKDELQILPRSIEDIPGVVPHKNVIDPGKLSIMNWNVEFFGAPNYGPGNDNLQLLNVAKVIRETSPDLVAFQEISNDTAFKDLLSLITGYQGRCSSRYSYSFDTSGDFPPQKLCFVYRTQVIRVIREKILFRKFYDSRPDLADIFASGRLPYVLEADVTNKGITERIYFVNVHSKSGADLNDLSRRELDARLLKDTLDQYYPGKKVMILGDFNDDVDESIVNGRPSPYSVFNGNYICISATLNNVIDHQFVSSELNGWSAAQLINPFLSISDYHNTTSDHLPVMSQFEWSMVTGIDKENEVAIFPNPANDILHVQVDGVFEYQIINAIGVLVARGLTSREILLSFPPGLYKLIINKGPISQAFTFIRSD